MKNVNPFVIKLFSNNFICILLTLLISQTSYSYHQFKQVRIELKSNQSESFFQKNDTIKKVNMELNELQKIAEFPGGLKEFYAMIVADFDKYDIDYDGFIKINVSFSIEKDGTLSSINVNNESMTTSMKRSIVNVLKSIKTKWSPAILNNQPVKSVYDLPIVFN
jgi:hypothetical protein